MFSLQTLFLATLVFHLCASIEVDNGVEGEPEVECQPNGIAVTFNVKNEFSGNVFVKGLFGAANCYGADVNSRTASLVVPFDDCNSQRTRSLNPRGIYVSNTVIVSFHPKFITKVDRAYKVQCFYMEAEKSVSQELEVSMLSTQMYTQAVPMPRCAYEILSGGPDGQSASSVTVGEKVFHRWTCEADTANVFCMNVHSCFVDDGNGDRVDLLDAQGCAQDRYLLQNLQYLTDLVAGQESHVFKYADRPQIFFKCQIAILIKESSDGTCPRTVCPDPPRGKRSARESPYMHAPTLDVLAELNTNELLRADQEKRESPKPCAANERLLIVVGILIALLFVIALSSTIWLLHGRWNAKRKAIL